MNRLLKLIKTSSLILFFVLLFFKLSTPINAIDPDYLQAIQSPGANLESFISGKLTPGGSSGLAPILGKYLTIAAIGAYDEEGKPIALGGANILGIYIAKAFEHQPISSKEYIAYVSKKMPFIQSIYAVDSFNNPDDGTDFLSPFIDFWQASRNMAYVFFIIIFTVLGFMIMFRSKLNPQTSVTIQLALPKIVISLILVTFSYAISGLIVDIAFLGNGLVNQYLRSASTSGLIKASQVDLLGFITGEGAWSGVNILSFMGNFLDNLQLAAEGVGTSNADLTVIFNVILAFTLLGTMIKIFFAIFTKYVTIILSSIFSPFVFLFGAIPGKTDPTAGYLRSMISAALTFPATYLLFILSSHIVNVSSTLNLRNMPPLNTITQDAGGAATNTALGSFNGGLALFVALGVLMIIPSIPQAIDKALGTGPGVGAGAADFGGALRKIPLIGGLLG